MLEKSLKVIASLIFSSAVCFLYSYFFLHTNFIEVLGLLLSDTPADYYKPHYNYFFLPSFGGINMQIFVCIFMLLFLAGLCFFELFQKKPNKPKNHTIQFPGRVAVIIGFVFLLILQTSSQIHYFGEMINTFQGKSLDQKFDVINNIESFKFTQYCREHLSGKYQGKLITDSDWHKTIDPYLIMYYLYPLVDFRQESDARKCVVVFNRENPALSVPEDYEVIGIYNAKSLIAVQRIN